MFKQTKAYLLSLIVAVLLRGSLGQRGGGGNATPNLPQGDKSMVSAQQALFTGQGNFREGFSADLYKFSFPDAKPNSNGKGGSLNLFDIDTDPALYVTKTGQNLVTLNPCGLNQPHLHPRSTEFSFIIKGTVMFGLVEENPPPGQKQRALNYNLTKGQGIFIPMGYVHYAQNLQSEPAQFIASFGSEDFGLTTINKQFFRIPPISLAATFNSSVELADKVAKSAVAQDILAVTKDCSSTSDGGYPHYYSASSSGEAVDLMSTSV